MKALIVHNEEMFRFAFKTILRGINRFSSIREFDSGEGLSSLSPEDCIDVSLVVVKSSCLKSDDVLQWNMIARISQLGSAILIGDPAPEKHNLTNAIVINNDVTISQMTYILRKMAVTNYSLPQFSETPRNGSHLPYRDELVTGNHGVDLSYFSNRKLQILKLVSEGLDNRSIAKQLGIAEGTIKAHMHMIMKVVKASNRTQLALWYNHTIRQDSTIEA